VRDKNPPFRKGGLGGFDNFSGNPPESPFAKGDIPGKMIMLS
jgi:hypothetical protein